MSDEKKPKLTLRVDDLAVPEIHIGRTPAKEELEEDEEEIQYDTVAIPEIHLRKKKQKE